MKIIYIDIDVRFEEFVKGDLKIYELIMENMKFIEKKFGKFLTYIRKSSSGNVHIKLDFENDISVLEHFEIRSLMHDDIYRIGIDLRRLAIQGEDEINRIFDMKFKNGVKFEAGNREEWAYHKGNINDLLKDLNGDEK